jgi:predicted nucleic acid-binding protein
MSGAEFIDTNIWVYAHQETPDDPRSALAWAFIHREADIVISAQVVAEYFNVMRRKDQEERIERNIARMLRRCRVQPLDSAVIRRTLAIRKRYGFSIWDSQIVAAALEAGCRALYTEDLQHGQVIETLTIIDPFQG